MTQKILSRKILNIKLTYWILFLILIIGFFPRIYNLNFPEFYYDEAVYTHITRQVVDENIPNTWVYATHNPEYHYLLYPFGKLFGTNPFSMRFPSVLFGLIGIVGCFIFVKLYFNDKIALLASFLIAILPFHVLYSRVVIPDLITSVLLLFSIILMEIVRLRKSNLNTNSILCLIASGILFAIGFMIKINPFMILYWLFRFILLAKEKDQSINTIKQFIITNLAALITVIALVFDIKTFFYFIHSLLWSLLTQVSLTEHPFSYFFYLMIDALSPLLLILLIIAIIHYFARINYSEKKTTALYMSIFLVIGFLLFMSIQPRKVPSHHVILTPFIALLISEFSFDIIPKIKYKKTAIIVLILLLIPSLNLSYNQFTTTTNCEALKATADFIKENVPKNTDIHIPHPNLWSVRYYLDDEYSDFSGRNTLARSNFLNISFDERINKNVIKKGDWVVLSHDNNDWLIMDTRPLANNLLFYENMYQYYTPETSEFVKQNSRLLMTYKCGVDKRKSAIQVYEFTQDNPYYNPPGFPTNPVVKKVCKEFNWNRWYIPAELKQVVNKECESSRKAGTI